MSLTPSPECDPAELARILLLPTQPHSPGMSAPTGSNFPSRQSAVQKDHGSLPIDAPVPPAPVLKTPSPKDRNKITFRPILYSPVKETKGLMPPILNGSNDNDDGDDRPPRVSLNDLPRALTYRGQVRTVEVRQSNQLRHDVRTLMYNQTPYFSPSNEEDNVSITAQRKVSDSTTASWLSSRPAIFDKGQTIPRPNVNEHPTALHAPGFVDHHGIRPVQANINHPAPNMSVHHEGQSLANGVLPANVKLRGFRASPEIDIPSRATDGVASVGPNEIQSPPVTQRPDIEETSPAAESSPVSPNLSPIGNNMPVWRDSHENAVRAGDKEKEYVTPFGTEEYNKFHGIPAGDEEQLKRQSMSKPKGAVEDWMLHRFRDSMHNFSRVAPSAGMRAYASARTMPIFDTEEGFLPFSSRITGLGDRPQVVSHRQTAKQPSEAAPASSAKPSAPQTDDLGALPWAHRSIPIDHPYIKAIWDRPSPVDRRAVVRVPVTTDNADAAASARGIILPTDHDIAWPTPHQAEEYARAQLAQKQNQYRMQQQQQQQYEMYSAGLMAPGDWGRLSIRYTASNQGETVQTVTRCGPGEVANGASMHASGMPVPQFCKESRVQVVRLQEANGRGEAAATGTTSGISRGLAVRDVSVHQLAPSDLVHEMLPGSSVQRGPVVPLSRSEDRSYPSPLSQVRRCHPGWLGPRFRTADLSQQVLQERLRGLGLGEARWGASQAGRVGY